MDALRSTVSEAGLSLTTAAVAWVLANPSITSAIIGASKAEQLADSLLATEKPLEPAPKDKLGAPPVDYRRGDASR